MTLDPSASIPKIIEGIDPFDDQSASLQFLETESEAVNPGKRQLIKEIYALVRKKVPDISPEDAR